MAHPEIENFYKRILMSKFGDMEMIANTGLFSVRTCKRVRILFNEKYFCTYIVWNFYFEEGFSQGITGAKHIITLNDKATTA